MMKNILKFAVFCMCFCPSAVGAVSAPWVEDTPRPRAAPQTDGENDGTVKKGDVAESANVSESAEAAENTEEAEGQKSAVESAKLPMIAIVIDDLGIKRSLTRQVLTLPAPVTAAFFPHTKNLSAFVALARKSGHEVILHLPMEAVQPRGGHEKNELTSAMSDAEIAALVARQLAAADGIKGVNNHQGSRLTANARAMDAVFGELQKHGVYFLDSLTTAHSAARAAARKAGVGFIERDVFLDNSLAAKDIRRQLELLKRTARENGVAVAIGHPHEATLDAVGAFAASADKNGFRLVPLSEAVAYLSEKDD